MSNIYSQFIWVVYMRNVARKIFGKIDFVFNSNIRTKFIVPKQVCQM